jgi:hypothetical protein
MSPTDYEMVVNVEAYSLVKNTSDVTLTQEQDGIIYLFLFVDQERYRQQNFRYIRDDSSNFDDDSPRLLNALSS